MEIQEMNDDRKMISGAVKVNSLIDRGFSDRAKSVVNNHAWIGAIALALPLFGLDNIIYIIALWHMYFKLCELAKQSFGANKTKSFIGAAIVNVIVASVLELACNALPIIGGIIGGAIIGFVSIKISGAAYLKALEILHNGNVSETYSLKRNR